MNQNCYLFGSPVATRRVKVFFCSTLYRITSFSFEPSLVLFFLLAMCYLCDLDSTLAAEKEIMSKL